MAEEKQCVLVIMGADEYGRKELLAMTDGFRESTQSWREVLLDLKRRGLKQDPKLAIGDGALGFWTALREVFATTREQRCWVHKTMNVLNAMPKSIQAKAKGHLHDIWQAETKAEASVAFDFFVATYGVKWEKGVMSQGTDKGLCAPVSERGVIDQTPPARCPTCCIGHIGLDRDLVNESQPFQMVGHEGLALVIQTRRRVGDVLALLFKRLKVFFCVTVRAGEATARSRSDAPSARVLCPVPPSIRQSSDRAAPRSGSSPSP